MDIRLLGGRDWIVCQAVVKALATCESLADTGPDPTSAYVDGDPCKPWTKSSWILEMVEPQQRAQGCFLESVFS